MDKHLFLMNLEKIDMSELSHFYRTMLHSWRTVFKVEREVDEDGSWVLEEPLFFNSMIQTRLLSSVSVSACLQRKGIVKLGHLLNRDGWKSLEELKEMTGLRSSRLTEKLMEGIVSTLPSSYRKYIGRGTLMVMTNEQELPGIKISYLIKTENEDEDVGSILSFKTPQLEYFESASKKAIYHSTVKVLHQDSLKGQKASRWPGLLKPDFLVRDRWRALYKPPIEKITADLQ